MSRTSLAAALPSLDRATLRGEALIFDHDGGLWLPDHGTLVVSDLHLEKGSSLAARGVLLPPFDTRATLSRLARLLDHYRPRRLVALGDSFHDRHTDARMHDADRGALAQLVGAVPHWVWIEGNHDPQPPAHLGGEVRESLQLGALTFQHEPLSGAAGAGIVAGHLHPSVRVRGRARTGVRRRCFALSQDRMVMPAFGAFTGGLNVCDDAFMEVFGAVPAVIALGRERVYPIHPRHVCPEAGMPAYASAPAPSDASAPVVSTLRSVR